MLAELQILVLALGAVCAGAIAVSLIVGLDLGPAARLTSAQRVLLAAALASGVIAFAIKTTIIAWLSQTIASDPAQPAAAAALAQAPPALETGRAVWQTLPSSAPDAGDSAPSPEKIALGARLFADPLLSRDGTLSCASCHDLSAKAGADGRRVVVGIDGHVGTRNVPTVYNAAFQARLFWDGRARSLEEQALGPILNLGEMGNGNIADVAQRVAARDDYRQQFAAAFGRNAPVDGNAIASALAAYERTLITVDTPYDRFIGGDRTALTPQQRNGMQLFEQVGCINCHAGPNFSAASVLAAEQGRSALRPFPVRPSAYDDRLLANPDHGASQSGQPGGVWRVPSLRNVALTGPYLHDGSVSSLTEMVRIMATVQLGRAVTDEAKPPLVVSWDAAARRFNRYAPAPISPREIDDIVAFLEALSSDRLKRAAAGAAP